MRWTAYDYRVICDCARHRSRQHIAVIGNASAGKTNLTTSIISYGLANQGTVRQDNRVVVEPFKVKGLQSWLAMREIVKGVVIEIGTKREKAREVATGEVDIGRAVFKFMRLLAGSKLAGRVASGQQEEVEPAVFDPAMTLRPASIVKFGNGSGQRREKLDALRMFTPIYRDKLAVVGSSWDELGVAQHVAFAKERDEVKERGAHHDTVLNLGAMARAKEGRRLDGDVKTMTANHTRRRGDHD